MWISRAHFEMLTTDLARSRQRALDLEVELTSVREAELESTRRFAEQSEARNRAIVDSVFATQGMLPPYREHEPEFQLVDNHPTTTEFLDELERVAAQDAANVRIDAAPSAVEIPQ